jgi:hypothetical protein
MWVAMGKNPSARLPRLNEHRLRNALLLAAVVLTPSVALVLLGLGSASR